jgi:hypothetical protein
MLTSPGCPADLSAYLMGRDVDAFAIDKVLLKIQNKGKKKSHKVIVGFS